MLYLLANSDAQEKTSPFFAGSRRPTCGQLAKGLLAPENNSDNDHDEHDQNHTTQYPDLYGTQTRAVLLIREPSRWL